MFPAALEVAEDATLLLLNPAAPAPRGAAPDGAERAAEAPPPRFTDWEAWLTDPFAMADEFRLSAKNGVKICQMSS